MIEKADFIIIGGGPAGYSCARYLSLSGRKTVLVERDEIGGVCLNRGCIPTKTIISSLRKFADFQKGIKREEYHINGEYSLNMRKVLERKKNVIETLRKGILAELSKAGVRIINGTAQFKKERVVEVDGKEFEADGVVIACGSIPSIPPPLKITENIIFAEESFERMENPPSGVTIIGGGAIGCEMAYIFSLLGSRVVVIELLGHILPFLDMDVAEVVAREMRKMGIRIFTGTGVESFEEKEKKVVLSLSSGEKIESELVLICAGRKGNLEVLNLEEAGIETERGWIKVNERLETSSKGVYAIGDCNGISLTAYAGYVQAVFLSNLIGGEEARYMREFIPGGIFTHPEVAWAGITFRDARNRGYDAEEAVALTRSTGRSHAEGELGGIVKIVYEKKTKKILGLQLVSPHATEIINHLALSLSREITLKDLSLTHHLHPTFSEVVWEASLKGIF